MLIANSVRPIPLATHAECARQWSRAFDKVDR